MLIRILGAIQRYFGVLARLQEIFLPSIIKVMVHKREQLTGKEDLFLDYFLISVRQTKRLTEKPVIVALIGLVGSGKSSVAQRLAPLIGATIINGDEIRVLLRKKKMEYDKARKIGEYAGLYSLGRGSNVIFDSDHIDPAKRTSLLAKAKEAGAKVIFIRTYTDSSDNPKIPGYNLDEIIGRNITAPTDEFFSKASTPWQGNEQQKGAVVRIREIIRRMPHHYHWENKIGGRMVLRKLPFKTFAEINTANPAWKGKVKQVAEKILNKF